MKKQRRLVSGLLAVAMALTLVSVPSVTAQAAETSGVGGFVNRCYQVTLNRDADSTGYEDWTSQLVNGKSDGANIAFGFVFSDEYKNAGKDNGAFVTDMYTLFLGRTPDEAGYNDWVAQLEGGADREAIFAGFANSKEFFHICTDYGITAGVYNSDFDHTQVNNVNMFVARMYKVCFNRLGDQTGQADWVNRLLSGELDGIDCANGFLNSQEYKNLNLSDEDYVENMYLAFMGRTSDPAGFNNWVSKLKAGYTRDEIFAGFANSNEFQNICDNYGINRGNYIAQDVHKGSPEDGAVAEASGVNLDQKNCNYFRLDNMDTSTHATFYAPKRGKSYKNGHIHPVIEFWSDEACDLTVRVTAQNPQYDFLIYTCDGPEGTAEPMDYDDVLFGEDYGTEFADPASADATGATYNIHVKKGVNMMWVDSFGGDSCNIEVSTVSGNASLRYIRTQYGYDTHDSSY